MPPPPAPIGEGLHDAHRPGADGTPQAPVGAPRRTGRLPVHHGARAAGSHRPGAARRSVERRTTGSRACGSRGNGHPPPATARATLDPRFGLKGGSGGTKPAAAPRGDDARVAGRIRTSSACSPPAVAPPRESMTSCFPWRPRPRAAARRLQHPHLIGARLLELRLQPELGLGRARASHPRARGCGSTCGSTTSARTSCARAPTR